MMPKQPTPLFLVYGGDDLDGLAYRVVEHCPPRLEDFLTYQQLGRSFAPRKQFQASGVSLYTTFAGAASAARRFGIGSAVAGLELIRPVMWTPSTHGDHITAWAPASTLLRLVLQCEKINDD